MNQNKSHVGNTCILASFPGLSLLKGLSDRSDVGKTAKENVIMSLFLAYNALFQPTTNAAGTFILFNNCCVWSLLLERLMQCFLGLITLLELFILSKHNQITTCYTLNLEGDTVPDRLGTIFLCPLREITEFGAIVTFLKFLVSIIKLSTQTILHLKAAQILLKLLSISWQQSHNIRNQESSHLLLNVNELYFSDCDFGLSLSKPGLEFSVTPMVEADGCHPDSGFAGGFFPLGNLSSCNSSHLLWWDHLVTILIVLSFKMPLHVI